MKKKIKTWLMSPIVTFFVGEIFFRLWGRRKKRNKDFFAAKNVLVIRLDEFGDMVLMSPFWRELRRNMSGAEITAVVNVTTANILEYCPYIDKLLIYSIPTFEEDFDAYWSRYSAAFSFSRNKLLRNRYDLAIYPRWDSDLYDASFLAYFSGAPRRIAYSEEVISHKKERNKNFDSLFTDLLYNRELKHEVKRNLDVLYYMGFQVESDNLESWVDKEDVSFAEKQFSLYGINKGDTLVAICPSGGNSLLKQWPLEKFVELAQWLVLRKCRILITGSKEETSLAEKLAEQIGTAAINMAGKTSLRQMAAMLKNSDLYIGNDTGTMHMAVSLGLPVIAIMGPTCSHRFGPWGQGDKILQKIMFCNPCGVEEHKDRCTSCIMERPYCIENVAVADAQAIIGPILLKTILKGDRC